MVKVFTRFRSGFDSLQAADAHWGPAAGRSRTSTQASPVAVSGDIDLLLEFTTIDGAYHKDSFYELTFSFICPTEGPTPGP